MVALATTLLQPPTHMFSGHGLTCKSCSQHKTWHPIPQVGRYPWYTVGVVIFNLHQITRWRNPDNCRWTAIVSWRAYLLWMEEILHCSLDNGSWHALWRACNALATRVVWWISFLHLSIVRYHPKYLTLDLRVRGADIFRLSPWSFPKLRIWQGSIADQYSRYIKSINFIESFNNLGLEGKGAQILQSSMKVDRLHPEVSKNGTQNNPSH
jgi:hypothetical protein